jgi:hypothetical protein
MDTLALKHFRSINEFLEKEGYVNTIKPRELRSFQWKKGTQVVNVIMNFSATEVKIKYTNELPI